MQQYLKDLGFNPGPVDGVFGAKTEAALRAFQTSANLDDDGVCGPLTWTALERNTSGVSRGARTRPGILTGTTIAIDPGHGGSDPGAVSAWGDKEKGFTLQIASKVKTSLEGMGAKVIFTRYGDYAPGSDWDFFADELVARASLANTNDADLFVSVHINSYPADTGVSGTMTFYRSGSSTSMNLAQDLADSISKATGLRVIDVQAGPYYVLNHTTMPAALVEIGFMTNWNDVANLRTSVFRDQAAAGVVNGILDYLGK